MKNFIIGLVIGFLLAGTGAYAVITEKAKKAATKENAEKIGKAAKEFGETIKDAFND